MRYNSTRAFYGAYTRVWFNGRTEAFQASDAGSIPVTRSTEFTQVSTVLAGLLSF